MLRSILNIGADGSFMLPANFDTDLGPLSLFAVGSSTPPGIWEFGARLLRPKTGDMLSDDVRTFTVGSATAVPTPNTCAGPTPNAALDPNFKPSLRVTLTKSSYNGGETVAASAFRLSNDGSSSGKGELKMWLAQPSAAIASLLNVGADGSISLPAALDANLGSLSLFSVTSTTETGLWEFGARVLDPVTGAVYSFEPASFRIQASTSAQSPR